MVCLSQNHPVMKEDIVGVDFFHDGKIHVSGKMKNELLLLLFTTVFLIDKNCTVYLQNTSQNACNLL